MINSVNKNFGSQTHNVTVVPKNSGNSEKKSSNRPTAAREIRNAVIPAGILSGGALLIYLGFRHPNVEAVLKRVERAHSADMDKETSEFLRHANGILDEFLESSLHKIYAYKDGKISKITKSVTNPAQKAKTPEELIFGLNEAFYTTDTKLNGFHKTGASEFDRFLVKMDSDLRRTKDKLFKERLKANNNMTDLIQVNSTPEYIDSVGKDKYHMALAEVQKALSDHMKEQLAKIDKYTDKKIKNSVNLQSKIMANFMTEQRDLIFSIRENLIKSAFKKMGKMLKIEEFRPSYKNKITLERFSHLKYQDMKPPKELPEQLDKMLNSDIFFKFIKSHDFSKISDNKIKDLFYSIDPHNNIRNIGFTIDRIRLLDAFEKSKGVDNSALYESIIAKFEYLKVNLQKYGESEFLEKSAEDFGAMPKDLFRAKLYSMNVITSRLGYHTLTQASRNFRRNYPQYSRMNFYKYSDLIRKEPENYFM